VAQENWREQLLAGAEYADFRRLSDWKRPFDTCSREKWRERVEWIPAVSVREDDQFILVSVDLPGISPNDIECAWKATCSLSAAIDGSNTLLNPTITWKGHAEPLYGPLGCQKA
jgi:HSP20 family molecular chaperone IbpA